MCAINSFSPCHPDTATHVSVISSLSGKEWEIIIPMSFDDFNHSLGLWRGGANIQTVFPDLSPDQREALMTGISQKEWDTMFAEPLIEE